MLESPARVQQSIDISQRGDDDDPTPPPNRQGGTQPRQITRIRTSHACDRCRTLRTKCSGEDCCSACTRDDATCIYSDRKRERDKKIVENDAQVQRLLRERLMIIAALKEVSQSPGFNPKRHADVVALLQRVAEGSAANSPMTNTASLQASGDFEKTSRYLANEAFTSPSERLALSTVGSPGRRGELSGEAQLYQGSGLSGYVGKLSEVSWIKRITEYLSESLPASNPEVSWDLLDDVMDTDVKLSFFTDEQNLLAVDEDYIEPLQLPHINIAVLLSEAYFYCVDGSFYFIEREAFLSELMTIYRAGQPPSWRQRPFLGICNMVWAIAARWMHIVGLAERINLENHILFFARSRSLGLDHRIQFDHPDVQTIQGMGLMAFYLLNNNSLQRAWGFLGQSIRHAVALGLHLKTANGIPESEQDKRTKLWNSMYRLETLLSVITGRPMCIQSDDMRMPERVSNQNLFDMELHSSSIDNSLPWSDMRAAWLDFLGPEQLVATTFTGGMVSWAFFTGTGREPPQAHFPAILELCHLSAEISARLFTAVPEHSWFDVQSTMRQIEKKLQAWQQNLPHEFKIDYQGTVNFDPRARLDLAMAFYSVKMILYRPCLCEIQIEHESRESHEFNRACARYCVEGAVQMIGLLPDQASISQVLQVFPWWAMLHYLGQAVTVLILELCLGMQHVPQATEVVLAASRKALTYLSELSGTSTSAMKAWTLLSPLFEKAVQRLESRT